LSREHASPYNILVIPRDHVETDYDLTIEQAALIFIAAAGLQEVSGLFPNLMG